MSKIDKKNIHILGICGTFMSGLCKLALEQGCRVTGSDKNYYSPIADQLFDMQKNSNLVLNQGFSFSDIPADTDEVIVGNVMSRGMDCTEELLASDFSFYSGPEWLSNNILKHKKVIAISGTHGKTSTTSMVAHMLQSNTIDCGYLIGGVPNQPLTSANLGKDDYFVIEADEYDTAFFDKRSKFIHYNPSILVINNIEFDHADIFDSVEDIIQQFHFLLRTLSKDVVVLANKQKTVEHLMKRGIWSQLKWLNQDCNLLKNPAFKLMHPQNLLSTYAVGKTIGLDEEQITKALVSFAGVKRRMEMIIQKENIIVIEDFAHHPTAIKSVIERVTLNYPKSKINVILELGSNTMKSGYWQNQLDSISSNVEGFHILNGEQDKFSTMIDGFLPTDASEHTLILILSNKDIGIIKSQLSGIITERYHE